MNAPAEAKSLFDWIGLLAPYVIATPLGFALGLLTSRYNFKLENLRFLRQERKEKIKLWRHEIYAYSGTNPSIGNSPVFDREEFARSETYLSLHNYLPHNLRSRVEFVRFKVVPAKDFYANQEITVTDSSINDLDVKDELLARINELEREWSLL